MWIRRRFVRKYCFQLQELIYTYDFLNFWSEAVEYTTPSGLPVLDNGDVIVYDNAAIHRFEGGQAVASWLNDMGIGYSCYLHANSFA
jgi:hypothetical protein